MVKAYLRAAEALRQETRAAADLDVVALLRLPGVIGGLGIAAPENEEEQEQLGRALEDCLREALTKLDEMRHAEGAHLAEELRKRLTKIGEQADQVRELAETLRPRLRGVCRSALKELLGGAALEPARLAQEAALLAERSDISEELDRLRSHLSQFAKFARWRRRNRQETRFSSAGNASRSQHHAFQNAGSGQRSAGHHRTGPGNQSGD